MDIMNKHLNSHEDIMKYTHEKLEAHFQNDPDFNLNFRVMYHFYLNKLAVHIPVDNLKEWEEPIYNAMKSQFFNGYFIIQEFLNHEEIGEVEDQWLEQHEGFITESIPGILRQITGENMEETITTEEMQEIKMELVTRYEDIRSQIVQMVFDIVCLGGKQAFIDERVRRNLVEQESLDSGFLSQIGTLNFVTPQHYLQIQHLSADAESWLLNYWSTIDNLDEQAGEVTVIQQATTEEGQVEYVIKIYLNSDILEHERRMIIETIIATVMERNNIERDSITVSIAVVEDFYIMVQTQPS